MVQCPYKQSPCISPMLVCCSGDLVVHLLQGGRGGISRPEDISCFHAFQYFCWGRFCITTLSSRGYICDAAFRMMVRKIFSPFWQFVGSRLLLSLSSLSLYVHSKPLGIRQISFLDCPITSITPETVSCPRQVSTHTTAPLVNLMFKYCALNSFPALLSHKYNMTTFQSLHSTPTTATNHHFILSCIHLQSCVKKASSPFSHTSTKLLHCWCHNY